MPGSPQSETCFATRRTHLRACTDLALIVPQNPPSAYRPIKGFEPTGRAAGGASRISAHRDVRPTGVAPLVHDAFGARAFVHEAVGAASRPLVHDAFGAEPFVQEASAPAEFVQDAAAPVAGSDSANVRAASRTAFGAEFRARGVGLTEAMEVTFRS